MSPSGNAADGLRQRNISGAGTPNATAQLHYPQQLYHQYQQQQQQTYPQLNQQFQTPQCPAFNPNNSQYAMPFGFPGQLNVQAMATQQAAMYSWMQQVYSQYMEQYMRMINSTTPSTGIASPTMTNSATSNLPAAGYSPFGFNPFLQQLPFLAPTTSAAGVATAGVTNPVISSSSLLSQPATALAQPAHNSESNSAAPAVAGGEQQPQQVQAQAQPEGQQAAAPRFPNIVQDEQDNRDWLDSFFSITRLAIFLTILYFNSSPLRCLAVVIIAGGIYLYHIGVLRLRNERNNNNINRNNNAADADQIRRGVRQVQQAAQADEQRNRANENADDGVDRQVPAAAGGEGTAAVVPENTDNNTASVISVLRTFVVTFFTSLLPETPTL
uniref:Homocysteine-responsive endoplasmic reticulum-resident ubiquitin-like domain member 2 protein n=2 Tax=Ceratitis capitata TaxID=7213 RepID=W8C1E5_CERCA